MTDKETIQYLWTHKTQDHPWLSGEELLFDRAEVDDLVGILAEGVESLEKDLA